MRKITSSIYEFETLIERGYLYVDKTEYLWKLVQNYGESYFLARPRRFGKSLTVSTLKAIFEGKKHLFEGLAISKKDYDWQSYPVIHLSFADLTASANTANGVKDYLVSKVNQQAEQFEVKLTEKEPGLRLGQLIDKLNETSQVVILVDEYDKPLIDNIQSSQVEDIRNELKCFYGVLKDRNGALRMLFITGVTKFCHVSLFSGFNNPTDISKHRDFATMFGYTQSEFETEFTEHIDLACQQTGMARQDLLMEIKQWYDGYRFHAKAESVYNPVSLAKFFENDAEFNNYWFSTGTPTFLMKLAKRKDFNIDQYLNEPVSDVTFDAFEIDNIDPVTLLLQSGYLTIKSTENKRNRLWYHLGYPNFEVTESFNTYLLNAYTGKTKRELVNFTELLEEALDKADMNSFYKTLDVFFAGISYEVHHHHEENFQNIFVTIFTLLGYDTKPEVHTSDGRIDAVIQTDKTIFVFEIKLNKDKTALSQIKEKEYYKKYMLSEKKIMICGINFDTSTARLYGHEEEFVKR